MPANISLLRPLASTVRATRTSSKALTGERSMVSMPGNASREIWERRTAHAVARRALALTEFSFYIRRMLTLLLSPVSFENGDQEARTSAASGRLRFWSRVPQPLSP